MTSVATAYRERAAQAHADAQAAVLENVRERAQRSEAAWTRMAERAEMVEKGRASREAAAGMPAAS